MIVDQFNDSQLDDSLLPALHAFTGYPVTDPLQLASQTDVLPLPPEPSTQPDTSDTERQFWSDNDWWTGASNVSQATILKKTKTPRQAAVATEQQALNKGYDPFAVAAVSGKAFNEKRWMNNHQNGRIPTSALTPIGNGLYLRRDAAAAFKDMRRAAKKDGVALDINEAYRTYATQARYWAESHHGTDYPVAAPGTSNHGWGAAVDVSPGSATWNWMMKHAKKYGFVNDVTNDAPHFDFVGGYNATGPITTPGTPKRVTTTKLTAKQAQLSAEDLNIAPVPLTTSGNFSTAVMGMFDSEPTMTKKSGRRTIVSGDAATNAHLGFIPAKQRSLFIQAAQKYGISARLLGYVAAHESSFNRKAVSPAGAQGELQVMPSWGLKNPFNRRENVFKGAEILAAYIHQMGSIRLGLAAYNAGASNYQAGLDYADAILADLRGN